MFQITFSCADPRRGAVSRWILPLLEIPAGGLAWGRSGEFGPDQTIVTLGPAAGWSLAEAALPNLF